MPVKYVSVKTKPGRIARTSPRGALIPDTHFTSVESTPYITRLIEVHQDLSVEEPKKPLPKTQPSTEAPPTGQPSTKE